MPPKVSAILTADDIVAGYEPGLPIVNGASLVARPGEILAVLGPNGAGKSTFIKALAGLVPIAAGRVRLGDRDITALPAHRKLAAGLAFVPQTENIFGSMSVRDNLQLAGDVLPDTRTATRRIADLLETFPDLARQQRLPAGRLSGGQRQMLAIARALMASPAVLMLDEPSAGLSPKLVADVFARLGTVRDAGTTVVLVEQNVRAALAIADHGLVLVEGKVAHAGPARTLTDDATVAALYLGGTAKPPGAAVAGARA